MIIISLILILKTNPNKAINLTNKRGDSTNNSYNNINRKSKNLSKAKYNKNLAKSKISNFTKAKTKKN